MKRILLKGLIFAVGAWSFLLAASNMSLAQEGWKQVKVAVTGTDFNTVYFADSKRGWIGGDAGYLSSTVDGGVTWTRQTVDTILAINDVYFRNKEDGYLLAGNSIFQTEDSGQNWREIRRYSASDFGGATPELYSVRFSGKKRGWVVGSISKDDVVVDSLIVYTNDGGKSWQRQRVPTTQELIHVDFANEKQGWIVGTQGTIFHTADGGETWAEQRSNTRVTLYHVDFRNEKMGWAVGERATVLKTTDGGTTWSAIEVKVRNTLLSIQFPEEKTGWIVGRGGTILRSDDAGATWIQQETKTTQNLFALFIDKKLAWAVGAKGMILRYER